MANNDLRPLFDLAEQVLARIFADLERPPESLTAEEWFSQSKDLDAVRRLLGRTKVQEFPEGEEGLALMLAADVFTKNR
tara:strand:+ start:2264 stop:2500 length:237 start_codon:yes stop_codon:yes gene_type:complete